MTGEPIVLGRGGPRLDQLRDGELVFESRRGLAKVTGALIEALPKRAPTRALFGHETEGAALLAGRRLWPDALLTFHHLDAYVGRKVDRALQSAGAPDVAVRVTADLPVVDGGFDLVALPFPTSGDSLLARDWIESAHDVLAMDGLFLAATDGNGQWLRNAVKAVFGKIDLQTHDGSRGLVVRARRSRSTPRRRERLHPIRVPRGGRVLEILTRPGVFSYGRLDAGTKALLGVFQASPGDAVLDLGSGPGALGLSAAVDAGPERVVLVDSNARATDLARRSADAAQLGPVAVCLRADLEDLPEQPYQLVLANPPYFSKGRIAAAFARAAAARLAPEGRFLLVAKAVALHEEILRTHFERVSFQTVQGYGILEARGPLPPVFEPLDLDGDADP